MRPVMINKKACTCDVVWLKVVSNGTVPIVPDKPKPINSGLRPILSDKRPKTGCSKAKNNSDKKEIKVDWPMVRCTVFTKNFCM